MTLNEAAEMLGLDPSTLRHQIRLGAFKAEKRGRDWWVQPREVKRYQEQSLGRRFGRKAK